MGEKIIIERIFMFDSGGAMWCEITINFVDRSLIEKVCIETGELETLLEQAKKDMVENEA